MTLSSTVMSSKVAGTWKVRPMPSRACSSGGARVTSTLSNTMRPVVGSVSPARQLKKVDLPAPFGPIRPMISPSSIDKSAPATARRLPKVLETFSALSSINPFPESRRDAMPHLVQPTRLEARDDHNDAAIENVGEAGAAAAEPGVGRGLQRDQDDGADQRAVERARAAERRNDDHLHRHQDAEAAFGIDEAGLDG